MKLVTGHDETIAAWLEQKFGVIVVQTPRLILGTIDDQGVLRGAFVLTWRTETTAELHLYGRTSNDTWRTLFRAAFGELGVYRLEVHTNTWNKSIKRNAPKFGFRFDGKVHDYYGPGEHALAYSMTPHQCRWLKYVVAVQVPEKA